MVRVLDIAGSFSDMAVLGDGTVVLAWYAESDGLVWIQKFDSSGDTVGEPLALGIPAGPYTDIELVSATGGGLLLTAHTGETEAYSRTHVLAELSSVGALLGTPQTIEPFADGAQGIYAATIVDGRIVSIALSDTANWDVQLIVSAVQGGSAYLSPPLGNSEGRAFAAILRPLSEGDRVLAIYPDTSDGSAFEGQNMLARVFSVDTLSFVTEPFLVNQATPDAAASTGGWLGLDSYAVFELPDGGIGLVWLNFVSGSVEGRFFEGAAGNYAARTDQITLSTANTSLTGFVDAVALPDGSVMIVYDAVDQDGQVSIWAQHVEANGVPVRPQILITDLADPSARPQVTALSADQVMISWVTAGVAAADSPRIQVELLALLLSVPINTATGEPSVAEDALPGTPIGLQVLATDPDVSDSVTYSLVTDETGENEILDGPFQIDPANGLVTVANTGQLDFEAAATRTVFAKASSTDGASTVAAFVVDITNVVETQVRVLSPGDDGFVAVSDDSWNVDGLAGSDSITTQAGADTVRGGLGDDLITLGAGDDAAIYEGAEEGFDVVLGSGGFDVIQALQQGTRIGLRSVAGIEQIDANGNPDVWVQGSAGNDTLDLSVIQLIGIERIDGDAGNDLIRAGLSVDLLAGGPGNDTLFGGNRSDVALYSGNRADYTVKTVAGVTTVTDNRSGAPDGVDTVRGLNILRFADIQLFQSAAANRTSLAGGAQRYEVANAAFVGGTNAAERFVVSSDVSVLVSSGAGDTVDLAGAIDSYTFRASGNQLQLSDGVYTIALAVSGTALTLRTASGSTSVAIDFAAAGAIKLGGSQIVGSATFDPLSAILDADNLSEQAQAGLRAIAPRKELAGTSSAETLTGSTEAVTYFTGNGGNDTLVGGTRSDVAVFSGNRSDYTLKTVAGVTTVTDNRDGSPDGVDVLRGLNILRFADIELFQSAAANRTALAGGAQRYEVNNSEFVVGTNAAEHFFVSPGVSALVATGSADTVDLAGPIDSYVYRAAGSQLQISDGVYTVYLSAPTNALTLRTASGSTTIAIDFAAGGVIKLGGTQVVGSATFDPVAAILDPLNVSVVQPLPIRAIDGVVIQARAGVADVFLVDALNTLNATIVGFESGDSLQISNWDPELGVVIENTSLQDGQAQLAAGNATLLFSDLPTDLFSDEASFTAAFGTQAITYVI